MMEGYETLTFNIRLSMPGVKDAVATLVDVRVPKQGIPLCLVRIRLVRADGEKEILCRLDRDKIWIIDDMDGDHIAIILRPLWSSEVEDAIRKRLKGTFSSAPGTS